jgi:hypothetical protein
LRKLPALAPCAPIVAGMQRLLLLGALFALVAAAGAAAAVWPNPDDLEPASNAQAGAIAWIERCPDGSDRLLTRRVAGSTPSSPRTVVPCSGKRLGQPALAFNRRNGMSYLVWGQVPKGDGPRGIFWSTSRNSGLTWTKPRLLRAVESRSPAVVKAAAYWSRLWIMASTSSLGEGGFLIESYDQRTGRPGGKVQGLERFRVPRYAKALGIVASRDGVAAFWLARGKGGTASWHFADTERVDPYDARKAVRFRYRGEIGLESRDLIFAGLDGLVYRLAGVKGKRDRERVVSYTLSRWRFRSHRFEPVLADVAVTTTTGTSSPLIVAQVDLSGRLLLAVTDPVGHATCRVFIASGVCSAAQPGQPFSSFLKLVAVTRGGQRTDLPLPLPYSHGPTGASLTVQVLRTVGGQPATMLMATPGGVQLFGEVITGAVSGAPDASYFSLREGQHSFFSLPPVKVP